MGRTKKRKSRRKAGTLTMKTAATNRILGKFREYDNLPEDLQEEINKNYNAIDTVKRKNNELLIKGAMEGNLDMVKFALRNYANVNTQDNQERTPLHLASIYGHLEIVEKLLKYGANINARDRRDWTPLHIASTFEGHPEVVKMLLDAGANVNARDDMGETPLQTVQQSNSGSITAYKQKEIVQLLEKAKLGCRLD